MSENLGLCANICGNWGQLTDFLRKLVIAPYIFFHPVALEDILNIYTIHKTHCHICITLDSAWHQLCLHESLQCKHVQS